MRVTRKRRDSKEPNQFPLTLLFRIGWKNKCICFELELVLLRTCSFICQGTSTRRQRSDLFSLRVKLPPVSALPKDTTSALSGLSSHYPFNIDHEAGKLWTSTF